jgi:hypothetical protein
MSTALPCHHKFMFLTDRVSLNIRNITGAILDHSDTRWRYTERMEGDRILHSSESGSVRKEICWKAHRNDPCL